MVVPVPIQKYLFQSIEALTDEQIAGMFPSSFLGKHSVVGLKLMTEIYHIRTLCYISVRICFSIASKTFIIGVPISIPCTFSYANQATRSNV